MAENHSSRTKSFMVGATLGAAIGTALSLLYAPERGEKTRQKLKRGLQESRRQAGKFSKIARDKAEEVSQQAVREFEVLRERVEEKIEKDSTPAQTRASQRQRRPRRFRGV